MPDRHQVVPLASGGVLHVEEASSAPSPALLFLHGVGGGAWSWEPQRAALSASHRCFTWEARGHGAAPRVADARLADYLQDAREALSHVRAETGRPVLLAAHSMGALLALSLACEQPEAVCGLFLVDPVYAESGDPPQRLGPIALWLARACTGVLARSYLKDGWLSRALSRLIFRLAFQDKGAMERAWLQQRTQVPLEYPAMLYESFEGLRGYPFHPFADVVAAPTQVVEALRRAEAPSRFGSVVARLRARLGARARYEGITGGHYLQLDRPREVTALLLQFAESVAR